MANKNLLRDMGMSVLAICACSAPSASADVFTIEKDDPRPFRVHCGPDETSKTKAMMRELANEVKRVTGVAVETPRYELASAGDFFVATEPWAAKGASATESTGTAPGWGIPERSSAR